MATLTTTEAQKFLKDFSSLFTKEFLIQVAMVDVPNFGHLLKITVSKPGQLGVGEEHITADFALKMIKEPKELELYYQRWMRGFASPINHINNLQ